MWPQESTYGGSVMLFESLLITAFCELVKLSGFSFGGLFVCFYILCCWYWTFLKQNHF